MLTVMKEMQKIIEELGSIKDPRRQGGNLRHKLVDIIFIGLVSIICGGTDYEHMEDTGYSKEAWLRNYIELPNGIPDSDTFRRVFERLNPQELASALQEIIDVEGKAVAIDGKTIRGSGNSKHKAYHVVSAWVAENQITLGQLETEEKSNEITAIPELLDMLDVEGSTVTIDAMGCQKDIAAAITAKGADYVLGLKQNQPALFENVKFYFDNEKVAKTNKTLEMPRGTINFISVDTIGKAHGGRRDILYLNEANHLNYKIAEQLIIRTREKVFVDFNPTSRFWVHDEILNKEQKRSILIKSTYKDNPFLEKEIIRALEARKNDENFWRVYGLGETGILEGRVFTNLEISDFDKNKFDRYYNGIDWGFSTDPFAFIRAAIENDNLYITDEIYSTNLLNKNSIPLVKGVVKNEIVTCDSSEPKSIYEFQASGINAYGAKKGKGSIEVGIKFLQSFSNIFIHKTCINAQREFFNYCFKTDLNGEIIPVPEDKNNHLIDALRYALEDVSGNDTISVIKGLKL